MKKFLTEDNIHAAIASSSDISESAKATEMEVSSARVNGEKLVAEFKVCLTCRERAKTSYRLNKCNIEWRSFQGI